MCGRYTLTANLKELRQAFPSFQFPSTWEASYNIAPTQQVPIVTNQGQRQVTFGRWGLVPFWAKDPSIGSRMINARAETVGEKPSFRAAYRRRRCLILADGFYEWHQEPGKSAKTPYYVQLSTGQPFAFAGLWELWKPDTTPVFSCTIITTRPNKLLAPLHNRMPVILPRAAYELWLATEEQEPRELQSLLRPYPAVEMKAYPVSTFVNNPRHDSPACTRESR